MSLDGIDPAVRDDFARVTETHRRGMVALAATPGFVALRDQVAAAGAEGFADSRQALTELADAVGGDAFEPPLDDTGRLEDPKLRNISAAFCVMVDGPHIMCAHEHIIEPAVSVMWGPRQGAVVCRRPACVAALLAESDRRSRSCCVCGASTRPGRVAFAVEFLEIHVWVCPDHRPGPPPRMARPARNEPCPCGSGVKHKRCCLRKGAS